MNSGTYPYGRGFIKENRLISCSEAGIVCIHIQIVYMRVEVEAHTGVVCCSLGTVNEVRLSAHKTTNTKTAQNVCFLRK